MAAETIGAAVVGVGLYGSVHCRTYATDHRTQLLKVWSRTRQRAEAVAAQYDCGLAHTLEEIADDPAIRVVSVATPDFAHREPAVMMLRAGKDVLLEKPMATKLADAEAILEAANATGAKLMVNFHNRWYPPVVKAKELVAAGAIGKPVHAYARLSNKASFHLESLSWSARSGPHWFLMSHTVDLVRWLLEEEACRVFATASKGVLAAQGLETYDVVQAQIIFENAIAQLEASWILPDSWRNNIIEMRMEVYGEKGRIGMNGDEEGIEVSSSGHATPLVLDFLTEEEPIRHFIHCVLNDRPPSPTGKDGIAVTRIVEAIERSFKTGDVVVLQDKGWC